MAKRNEMWRMIVVVALVLSVIGLAACGGRSEEPGTVEPEQTAEVEAMFQESCATCHGLDTVTSQKKTRDEWEQTVDRMIQKGAEVMDKQALLDYLAANYGP